MTFNLRLSRARMGVVAMRLTIGYYEIGEKKGVKFNKKKRIGPSHLIQDSYSISSLVIGESMVFEAA